MREMGLEPLEPYPGMHEPWRCRCAGCGHAFTVSYRRRARAVCRECPPVRRVEPTRVPVARAPVAPEAAAHIMEAAGFEPLVPYPGKVQAAWPCRCTVCGHKSTPRLSGVRDGSRCRFCSRKALGAHRVAANAAAAVNLMRAVGFEPLEDYPGSHQRWRCRCTRCGTESTPRHATVRRGRRCRNCWRGAPTQPNAIQAAAQRSAAKRRVDPGQAAVVMRGAGLEPAIDYPGSGTPWPCRCTTCGRAVSPSYDSVRSGHGCRHCAATAKGIAQRGIPTARRRNTEKGENPAAVEARADGRAKRRPLGVEAAERELRAAGFEPIAPYPGRVSAAWHSRCVACGSERRPRLIDLRRRGSGCRCVSTTTGAGKTTGARGIAANAANAVAVMQKAGFEPLEPYPGSAQPWRCRCTNCHTESTPRYINARNGHGCRHCWGGTRL